MAHFSVTSAPFCSIQTMWEAISSDDCLTHFGGIKITYPYGRMDAFTLCQHLIVMHFISFLALCFVIVLHWQLSILHNLKWMCVNGVLMTLWLPNYNYACYTISFLPELYQLSEKPYQHKWPALKYIHFRKTKCIHCSWKCMHHPECQKLLDTALYLNTLCVKSHFKLN